MLWAPALRGKNSHCGATSRLSDVPFKRTNRLFASTSAKRSAINIHRSSWLAKILIANTHRFSLSLAFAPVIFFNRCRKRSGTEKSELVFLVLCYMLALFFTLVAGVNDIEFFYAEEITAELEVSERSER